MGSIGANMVVKWVAAKLSRIPRFLMCFLFEESFRDVPVSHSMIHVRLVCSPESLSHNLVVGTTQFCS